MPIRVRRTWITVMVLALGAEGSAAAQSAPAQPGSASDPALARMAQTSVSVGPQLEAARASLGGKTKKSDASAPFDWNTLANRQAVAGTTVANGFALPSSAGVPIPTNAGGADSLQTLHGDATGATTATAGPAIRVVPVGDIQQGGATPSAPAPHAEAVIRGQINPAAKSCYENDPDSKSKQPGKLILFIKLTPAGQVDSVAIASSIGLSPSVVSCITTAAGAAKFAAPGTNGATVRAAFSFSGQEDPTPPAAAHPKGAQGASASGHAAPDPAAKADTQPTNAETAHR